MDLLYNEPPIHEEQQFIEDKLFEYNKEKIDGYRYDYFTYTIVDDSKGIVAGINCEVGGGWLYIIGLWIDDKFRGLGFGEKLLFASCDLAVDFCRGWGLLPFLWLSNALECSRGGADVIQERWKFTEQLIACFFLF